MQLVFCCIIALYQKTIASYYYRYCGRRQQGVAGLSYEQTSYNDLTKGKETKTLPLSSLWGTAAMCTRLSKTSPRRREPTKPVDLRRDWRSRQGQDRSVQGLMEDWGEVLGRFTLASRRRRDQGYIPGLFWGVIDDVTVCSVIVEKSK